MSAIYPADSGSDAHSVALASLITRYGALMRLAGTRRGLTPGDFDDLLADVRMRLANVEARGASVGDMPAAYLYRIASTSAVELLRRQRIDPERPDTPANPAAVRSSGGHRRERGTQPDWAIHRALGDQLAGKLLDLPLRTRAVLRMYLTGAPREEIAELLGWTDDDAATALELGLQVLRARMDSTSDADASTVEERWRQAYAVWLERMGAAQLPPTVDPDAVARLVARDGTEEDRLAVLDLVLRDPRLLRELAVLQSTREASDVARGTYTPPTGRWRRSIVTAIVAAGGLLALWQLLRPSNAFRSPKDDVVFIEEWQDRPLAWAAVPGARDYRVEIVSADGDSLQAVITRDTMLAGIRLSALPVDARWRVSARLADSTTAATPFRQLTTRRN